MMTVHCGALTGLTLLLLSTATQFADSNAQLLCFANSDDQCNGTEIEDISTVSDCCLMNDGWWYIEDTVSNTSLESNDTLECRACIKLAVGFEETYLEIEEAFTKVELCVNITELVNPDGTQFEFQLEVSTEKLTASPRDFVSLKNLSLGVFSDSRQRNCFKVEIMNDKVVESYEEFTVHLRAHGNSDSYYPQAIDPDTATIRILDNDYFIGFERTLYEVMEEDENVEVCVISKGPPFLSPLTVTMATVAGRQDADFVSSVSEMIFTGGQRRACARVQVINDIIAEKTEYFHIYLTPKPGVKINPNLASVKIIDNDVGGVFSIERQRYFTSEADASVEVCVVHDSGELEEPVELTVCTSNGNAINSYDYISVVSAVVFNSSSPTRQCVSIPLVDDNRPEATKTFSVLLVTDHPSTIVAQDKAIVTIRDNDELPVLDSDACIAEDFELVAAQRKSRDTVVKSVQSVFRDLVDDTSNATLPETSRDLYEAIADRFNETTTDSGFIKFTEAINEISSGYALACSGPRETTPTADDIPQLAQEFAAAYEEGPDRVFEIRTIYGQMLCLDDLLRALEEQNRERRQAPCPARENCRCPPGGISNSITCSCEFFDCLDRGDELKSLFLERERPSCLAFVIDTTGSMKDEVNLATEVIKDFLGSEEGDACYLLVPFNDDGTGPGPESNIVLSHRDNLIADHLSLLRTLESSFQPNSGGDCREYSFEAINRALNQELYPNAGIPVLQPGSQVIVLTDAPPKGDEVSRRSARDSIIELATQMNVCMHFFLPSDTFNCLVDYPDGVEEYTTIADETGGIVINSGFDFSDFASTYTDRPCQYVDLEMRRRKRDVIEEQSCHVFRVSTLSHLLKLTAKTLQRKVTVTRPDGTTVELNVVDARVQKDKLALLSERGPLPGEWSVCVKEGALEITTETRVSMDFTALYYVQSTDGESLYLTPSPPPGCTAVRMAVSSSRSDAIHSAELQLLANDGAVISQAGLDKCGLSWTGNVTLPTPGTYSYQLEGQDLYTNPFVYFTQKSVEYTSGQEYYSLSYTGRQDIVVEVGELVELKFQLDSVNRYGPTTFKLTAERIAGFTFFAEPAEITLSPGESAVVKAMYLPASSSLEPGRSYTARLTASNGCTSLSASSNITIMEEAPPVTLDPNVCGCLNGGTCNVIEFGSFSVEVCGCPPGFRGPKCEFLE